MTRPDGTEVDVRLDDKFAIISADDDRALHRPQPSQRVRLVIPTPTAPTTIEC